MKYFLLMISVIIIILIILNPNIGKENAVKVKQPTKYILYYIGAEWCGPCAKMKQKVWDKENNKDVHKFLKDNDIHLHILEGTNDKHLKYLTYYKVTAYPTTILVERKHLNDELVRIVGYCDKVTMLKTLKEKLTLVGI